MKLTGIELRRIRMPLVAPFRTSFGTETERDVLLLRAVTDEAEGWGECVAMSDPLYSSEYVEAAADVLRRYLVPALAARPPESALIIVTRARGSKRKSRRGVTGAHLRRRPSDTRRWPAPWRFSTERRPRRPR